MYTSTLSVTSALDGGGWSTPRPGRFTPIKTRYPLYRRLGGPQGRSGRVRKISPPTGIRSPDGPARSESLYRLSCRGPYSSCDESYKKRNTAVCVRSKIFGVFFKWVMLSNKMSGIGNQCKNINHFACYTPKR